MDEKSTSPDSKGKRPENPEKKEKEEQGGSLKDFIRVFSYADRIGWSLNAVAALTGIASGVILPFMSIIFGGFITKFNNFAQGISTPDQFRRDANSFVLWFIYLFVAKFFLTYISAFSISVSAIRTTRAIREAFLEKVLRQEIAFFDRKSNGSVAVQVTTNGNRINQGIADKLGLIITGLSTFFAAFIIALVIQWKLSLITMTVIPAIFLVTGISIGFENKYETQADTFYSQAGTLAQEVFSSIRTVHAFWAHDKVSAKYNGYLDAAHQIGNHGRRSINLGLLFSNQQFFIYAGMAVAFWQGFRMFRSGEIEDAGEVFTIVLSVVIASTSLTQIAPQLIAFSNAASSASELFAIIDKKSLIDPFSDDGDSPESCEGQLEIKDVEFAYPSRPDTLVLRQMSLSVPAGKTTALVGASGSGKSTIVGLLERWYDPTSGSLHLDGQNINSLNLAWLRSHVRIVEQEPTLLSGTIFDNVIYGLVDSKRKDLSHDEQIKLVEEACVSANAHDFISKLPDKYNTWIGERASMLSGGQKQRIAIARSIISDPMVLLLDEATSALDPRAELVVQEALDKVSANRTTLVIAHRLSTIKNADNIAVMADGQIVEQGTHEELITADGTYARLVKAQTLNSKEDSDSSDDEDTETSRPQHLERVDTQNALDLARTTSQTIEVSANTKQQKTGTVGYSLTRCAWIFLSEQKSLTFWYAVNIIAIFIGSATYPGQAIIFSRLLPIFQGNGQDQMGEANFWALMLFVLAIGNLIAYLLIGVASNIISQESTHKYRLEMFNTTARQDMEFFDLPENSSGSIASRLSSMPTQLQELMSFNLALILLIFVNIIATSILAITIGWKLGLVVVFGGLPLLVLSGLVRIKLETRLEADVGKRFAETAGIAGEAVMAIRTVASLTLEKSILERYREKLNGIALRSTNYLLWTMLGYSLSQSLEYLVMALGFWYGAQLVSTGEYTSEQFFIVFLGVLFSGQAAAQFFGYTTSITKAGIAANYILWLRGLKPTISETDSNQDIGPKSGSKDDHSSSSGVALQKTEFRYPQRLSTRVLKGINIPVKPGQFIALVGASGCGKSTIISLLERFYDPTSGTIELVEQDGAQQSGETRSNISVLSPRLYRRKLALVQQEPTLYQGTVRENIALGLETKPSSAATTDTETAAMTEAARIESACKQAAAFDFVSSLPDGFETHVGSRGLQLSGGQRQRIAIARALVRNPDILLLDEATSALDVHSEKIIQKALEEASRTRTTIAVAHRLSTIKDAHVIYVLAEGRVVESGSHEELVARRGVYYEMCQGQRLDQA